MARARRPRRSLKHCGPVCFERRSGQEPLMADVSNGNGLREHMLLFSRFLRNPRRVGAFAPSGPELAREMVARLPSDEPATVVELGPGTGALTGAIVDRLHPSARFLTVDIEPTFVAKIRARWPSVES